MRSARVLALPALALCLAATGKKVFNKCKTCHTLEAVKNRVGPSLAGLFGRSAGSVEGFKYSDVMKSSGITWDDAALDAYFANPKGYLLGNKMIFVGLKKEAERADVIAFLKQAQ